MAELVDALALGPSNYVVRVRVSPPVEKSYYRLKFLFLIKRNVSGENYKKNNVSLHFKSVENFKSSCNGKKFYKSGCKTLPFAIVAK